MRFATKLTKGQKAQNKKKEVAPHLTVEGSLLPISQTTVNCGVAKKEVLL
jgi:hypothetical protein